VIIRDAGEPLLGSFGNRKQLVTYPSAAIEYCRQRPAFFRPDPINNVRHVAAFLPTTARPMLGWHRQFERLRSRQ
jgi:hypothetical protein